MMTAEEVQKHNMAELNLTADQLFVWGLLEKSPMGAWPDSLKKLCKETSDKQGWCGDVQAHVVADWVRGLGGPVAAAAPELLVELKKADGLLGQVSALLKNPAIAAYIPFGMQDAADEWLRINPAIAKAEGRE